MTPQESKDLQRLLDAVLAVSSELHLPVVLERIVEAAIELVGARYVALGLLDESGRSLSEFIYRGVDEATVEAIGHPPEGLGILGLLIVEPMPIRLDDLRTHPQSYGFPEGHPSMCSFLGVPIRVRGEIFGNLYLCDKSTGDPFTDTDEMLVVGLAGAAGVAIDNARLHARVSDLSVLEDRERIARDLHDSVIQRLFATGLMLEAAAAQSAEPAVVERLEHAVEELDETVRHVRTTIFELHQRSRGARSLRRELLDMATELGEVSGCEPRLRFSGPIDSTLDEALADETLAVSREALTNAVKHSGAKFIEMEVAVEHGYLTVLVRDDGVGIAEPPPETGLGLANLRGRAEQLGGTFAVSNRVVSGTELRWQVPLGSAGATD
jgi:signal transduction histidine kinase